MAKKEIPSSLKELNAGIASIIRETRTESKMTQTELAKAVGVDQSVISRLEKPGYDGYDLSTLFRIFDIFDMDIEIGFTEREHDD